MNKKVQKDITLGIFITIGLLLFIGAVYYIGSQQQLFGEKLKVVAIFKNVSGLQPGNNVRFSGIRVGTVKDIEIVSDSTARVIILINDEAGKFIKKDAYATIESDGLMGNKIVSISPGSAEQAPLADGDEIRTKEPVSLDDVISSFKQTSDNARNFTGNLTEISNQIKNAEGLLGKIVSDSLLAHRVSDMIISLQQTSKNADHITREVERVTSQLNNGNGLLARVINDDQLGNSIETAIDSVQYAGRNLAIASRDLRRFMKKLNDNEGVVDKLLNDSTTATNLKETIINIRQGTEDLDEVMNTVNNSWLLNLFSGKDKDNDH